MNPHARFHRTSWCLFHPSIGLQLSYLEFYFYGSLILGNFNQLHIVPTIGDELIIEKHLVPCLIYGDDSVHGCCLSVHIFSILQINSCHIFPELFNLRNLGFKFHIIMDSRYDKTQEKNAHDQSNKCGHYQNSLGSVGLGGE